jgi:tRNA G10  N-methylase Trm11
MARQAFLFQFAQIHAEFRLPELESVSKLYGFEIDISGLDITRPFAVLEVTEEQARLLARRCILIKYVQAMYELFDLLFMLYLRSIEAYTSSMLRARRIRPSMRTTGRILRTYGIALWKTHRSSL